MTNRQGVYTGMAINTIDMPQCLPLRMIYVAGKEAKYLAYATLHRQTTLPNQSEIIFRTILQNGIHKSKMTAVILRQSMKWLMLWTSHINIYHFNRQRYLQHHHIIRVKKFVQYRNLSKLMKQTIYNWYIKGYLGIRTLWSVNIFIMTYTRIRVH